MKSALCFLMVVIFIHTAEAVEIPVDGIFRAMYLTRSHSPAYRDPQRMRNIRLSMKNSTATIEMKHPLICYGGMSLVPKNGNFFREFSSGTVFCAEIRNEQPDRSIDVTVKINSGKNADQPSHQISSSFSLTPGEQRILKVPLRKIEQNRTVPFSDENHFWLHGLPSGMPQAFSCDTAQVAAVVFYSIAPFLDRNPARKTSFSVTRCWISDELRESPIPWRDASAFFPFIDRYGQFRHQEWPEKIHSDSQLRRNAELETEELNRFERPAAWNRFGGWQQGPSLKATGNFRTEKYQGKWFFVDPEGRLFFSMGVNAIQCDSKTSIPPVRANWTEDRRTGVFSWQADNLQKKYGGKRPFDRIHQRLASWGLNTIGAWSDPAVVRLRRTPYTVILIDRQKIATQLGKKFYDPYHPALAAELKSRLTKTWVRDTTDDPFCIGYFITNELFYGPENQGMVTRSFLARKTVEAADNAPAKKEFLKDLRQKYKNIEAFNTAWGMKYASFDSFLSSRLLPNTSDGQQDMENFHWKTIETFFRLSRDAVHRHAPGKLYLGARLMEQNNTRWGKFAKIYGKYCDVASYNLYHSDFSCFTPDVGDKPILITEMHLGILQRGMFHPGLRNAGISPNERGTAVQHAYKSAIGNPAIVGVHWFTYCDQPIIGRLGDGENLNVGLVDVADTPYPELIDSFRKISENMYRSRTSK